MGGLPSHPALRAFCLALARSVFRHLLQGSAGNEPMTKFQKVGFFLSLKGGWRLPLEHKSTRSKVCSISGTLDCPGDRDFFDPHLQHTTNQYTNGAAFPFRMMNYNTLDTGQASTGQQLIHDEIDSVANAASTAATGLHGAARSLCKKSDHHRRHAGSKGHRLRAGSDATFVVASRDDEGDVEMAGPDGNTSSTSGSLDKDKGSCIRIRPVRTDTGESADSSARDSILATTTCSTGSNSRTTITVPTATSTSTKKSAHTEFTVTTRSRRSNGSSRKSKSSKSSDSGANPQPRVVYGPGAITQLPAELERLQLKAPVIVSSPSRIPLGRKIQSLISNLDSRILDSAVVNVPTRVIDDAVARISNRDCVISVGGDSAVGLAKAISQRKQIPHICIPTTYSGAEPALLGGKPGQSGKLLKYGNREVRGTITVVIYDEDLTMSSPKRFSAPSGIPEDVEDGRRRKSGKDEDAQWSYLHLPGV